MPYIKQLTDDGIELNINADWSVNRYFDEIELISYSEVYFVDSDGVEWILTGKDADTLMDGIIDDDHLYDNVDVDEEIQDARELCADMAYEDWKESQWN